jgi:L-alanine-DL-glutamate epimerase-like enolase superfamily enzyme
LRLECYTTYHVSKALANPMVTSAYRVDHLENVVLECQSDGLSGVGYVFAFTAVEARALRMLIEQLAEDCRQLPDCSPIEVWHQLRSRHQFSGPGGLPLMALACLDTALWDLHAQRAGMPLYMLLGSIKTTLPVYATGGGLACTSGELVNDAIAAKERGYHAFKMKVGRPRWREDVDRVRAVREAIGDDMQLMADANQAWSLKDALQVASALSEFGLTWLEEPVDALDVEAAARLTRELSTPIAAGESVFGPEGLAELISGHATDVIMPNLMRCGGPTAFSIISSYAYLSGTPVSSHTFAEISCHLVAAAPTGTMIEHLPGWWDDLFDNQPIIRAGELELTKRPGLGLQVSSDTKRRSER